MKKKLLNMVLVGAMLFTAACSSDNTEIASSPTPTVTTVPTATPEPTATPSPTLPPATPTPTPTKEEDSPYSIGIDNIHDITEGSMYEAAMKVYEGVAFTGYTDLKSGKDGISISINLSSESVDKEVDKFFETVWELLENCNFEEKYDAMSFIMKVDDKHTGEFNMIYYKSPTDFTSTMWISPKGEHGKVFEEKYHEYFKGYDMDDQSEKKLNDLKEKFGAN